MTAVDYSVVTEIGGTWGTRAQLARACNRYYFAGEFCVDRDVLEVACGVGQGLGHLATKAKSVIGMDIDERNLAEARRTYEGRPKIQVVHGDAQDLPFPEANFDVVILFEAIYYLPRPEDFVREARRVLRPGGTLLICTANKDFPDFAPGAFTHRYFNPPELSGLLEPFGFRVEMFGDAPTQTDGLKASASRFAKRTAVRLHLIPKTMRGKVLLKRAIFGPLVKMPKEVKHGVVPYAPPLPIPSGRPTLSHLVIHCVARMAVHKLRK